MKTGVKILFKSGFFCSGLVLFLLVVGFAVIYPAVNHADPFEMVAMAFQPPQEGIPLGTDNFGRNLLLELAHGTRTSLQVGFAAGVIATLIGLFIGLLSGYRGGLLDNLLTTFTNMFIVIPSFIILVLVSVSLNSRNVALTSAIIGLTCWPWTARAVRAQTSSLRNRDHVNIARITGFSTSRIIMTEILPYIMSYVVMAFIIQLASGILAEASISMLGLGPLNTVSLGVMLNWALVFEAPASGAWWTFLPPAGVIGAITFSLYMMNLGMDEIFNPKIRS